MSFLETNHVNGRRRISQPTREEWLASLQQQIQEKDRQKQYKSPVNSWAEPSQLPKLQNQDADHHLKNAVASPAQFSHSRTLIHEQAQRHVQEDTMYNEGALPLLPGRMRVTRLSKEEWINSLQKQIQEKQQHKQKYRLRFPEEENDLYANQRQEQAKSAVLGQSTTHVNTTFDAINGEPPGLHQQQTQNLSIKPQESVSILPQSAPSPLPSVTGGRRRASSSMSREQYLKSLEEQIQEKKRLEELTNQKESSSRRRRHHSDEVAAITVQSQDAMNHNKEPSKSTESSNEEVTKNEENISHHVAKDIVGLSEGLATCNIRCNIESKNEDGGGSMPKILELWDEMKKQNEDLKKQLQEQNAVLSSLQQTMTSSKTYSQSEENPTIDIHSSNIIKKNPKKTSTKTLENKQKQAVRNNKSKESMTTTDMSKQKKPQVKTKRPNVTAAAASMNEKKRIREDTNKSHKEKIKEVESPQIDEKEKKSSEKVLKTKERQKSIPSQAKEITNNGVNEEKIGTIVVAVEKKEMASLEEIMKDTNSKNNQIMVNEHSIDGNEELPLGEEGSTFVPYPEEEAGGAEEEGELKSSSSFSLGNTESCFIPIDDNNPFFK